MAETINAPQSTRAGLLSIPAVLVSLLPVLACSWPAIAALVASLGLGFLGNSTYMLPLTATFLAVAVVGLCMQIRTAGYGPLILGVAAAATILSGTFLLASEAMTYSGVVLLMASSAWSLTHGRIFGSKLV